MGIFRSDSSDNLPIIASGVSPARAVAYNTPRQLTAAATQIKINDKAEFEQFKSRRSSGSSIWQGEAWEYYDAIGEIKYAFNLVASVISRIRIFPAVVEDSSQSPVAVTQSTIMDARLSSAADRALERLNSAFGGQPGLLRDAALNLSVCGECYLVQIPERIGSGIPESWDIRSIDEIKTDPKGGYSVIGRREMATSNNSGPYNKLPSNAFIGRIWRSHPRYSDEADSSLRGLLDLCSELLLLNRTFRATARSRLNAGALYLPDGLSVAAQGDVDIYDDDSDLDPALVAAEAEDDFEEQLIDAMTTPIRDEESASAVVPLIIRGPAELGDKIKQFKFERSFDPALAQRADRVLERILQGLDVPKDIVTGLANVKYCLSDDTEILTKRGWLTHDQVSLTDEVLTLNRTTGLSEWQTPSAINVFDVDENDQLLSIESEAHSSLSTMNHGWHVRRQTSRDGRAHYDWIDTTSADMAEKTNLFIPTAARHTNLPTHKTYTDDFVELVAWWYTEGYLRTFDTARMFDRCLDRGEWTKTITDRRKELGLSRREVVQRMGKHLDNAPAASSHFIHMEKAGAVQVQERVLLAEALEVRPDDLNKFFTPRPRAEHGVIAQSMRANPDNVSRIRDVLGRICDDHDAANGMARGRVGELWWTESSDLSTGMVYFTISDELVQRIRTVCPDTNKVVNTEFITLLTEDQLNLFIDVSILADGYERPDGRRIITQAVPERLDSLEMAVILTGRTPIRRTIRSAGHKPGVAYELAIKQRDCVSVNATTREIVTIPSGKVWCPTTPNGSWMARRRGKVFYTLNSNALQIDETLYKTHIEPLMLLIVDALTVVYLRPYLIASGFSPEEVNRIVVWYDPSAVSTRNDRATDADSGYDRYAVSLDTWRRAHGFSDADAPTANELAIRMMMERGAFTPELTEAMLSALAPEVMDSVRNAQQESSVGAIPPEVQQALQGAEAVEPETETPTEETPAPPQEEQPNA